MDARCNLAFVSAAHIHVRGFLNEVSRASDGRKAAVIWDDNPGRGKRHAALCGARFEPDLAALLDSSEIDAFVLCPENDLHLPLLEKVLPVGKPVMCEKPLAISLEDLEAIRRLHEQHPAPLTCGYFLPFGAVMQGAARVVREGGLGEIRRARCRSAHFAAYHGWFKEEDLSWFGDPARAGGGGFLDMGTHAVHLVRTLFGPVREAFAVIENHGGDYPEVDSWGQAMLRTSDGILCVVEGGWSQSGGSLRHLEIVGTERTLWVDEAGCFVNTRKAPPESVAPGKPLPDRLDRLVGMVRGTISQAELERDLEAAFDSVAIMAACYQSSLSGGWTNVPEIFQKNPDQRAAAQI